MKNRENIQVSVTIEVKQIKMYESQHLATANKSVTGSMDPKEMASAVKNLMQEAKEQVISGLEKVLERDEAEEAPKKESVL